MLAILRGQEISQRILADISLRTNSPRHHAYLTCDVKARHANAAVLSLLASPLPIYPTPEAGATTWAVQRDCTGRPVGKRTFRAPRPSSQIVATGYGELMYRATAWQTYPASLSSIMQIQHLLM